MVGNLQMSQSQYLFPFNYGYTPWSINDPKASTDVIDFKKTYPNSHYVFAPLSNQTDLLKMEYELFLANMGINPYSLDNENFQDCLGIFNYSSYTLPQFTSYLNSYSNMSPARRWMQNLFDNSYNTAIDSKKFSDKRGLAELQKVYNPQLSKKLASIAHQNADRTSTLGWCAKGVMDSLQISGLDKKGETRVAAAWMAVNTLGNSKNFQRVNIENKKDLINLPAGCIIVWNKSEGHPYGHITVTLGNGKEASDHVQDLITNRNAEFAVFVPVENKKTINKT